MAPPESKSFQDVLVHYTSAQGLEGILRSNTLWATHSSHTNDGEELQILKTILPKFSELDSLFDERQRKDISLVTEAIQKRVDVYICSFSQTKKTEVYHQNNGRLSQWRAYGNYGIVFPLQKIEAMVNSISAAYNLGGAFGSGEIMYIDPDAPIPKDFNKNRLLFNYILALGETVVETRTLEKCAVVLPTKSAFFEAALFLKDKGFEEENEYRLVLMHLKKDYLEAFHNTNTNGEKSRTFEDVNQFIEKYKNLTIRRDRIVPYIDFFQHNPLPIEKILIGPAPAGEQAERKKTVEALLRHLDKDIPVVCSAIPYRG